MGNVYIFDSLLLYFHGLISLGFCTKLVALRLTNSVWKKTSPSSKAGKHVC